jgi:hypothetical protein
MTCPVPQVKAELCFFLAMPLQPLWFMVLMIITFPVTWLIGLLPSLLPDVTFALKMVMGGGDLTIVAKWIVMDGLSVLLPWLRRLRAEAASMKAAGVEMLLERGSSASREYCDTEA